MVRGRCASCFKLKQLGQTRKLSVDIRRWLQSKEKREKGESGLICDVCRRTYYRERHGEAATVLDTGDNGDANVEQNTEAASSSMTSNPIKVRLPIMSCGKTHCMCVVCGKQTGSMKIMPVPARMDVFVFQGVIVPSGCRCCVGHLTGKHMKAGYKVDCTRLRKTEGDFDVPQITELIERLRDRIIHSTKRRVDFDDPNNLQDDDIVALTGISALQFDSLVRGIVSMRRSHNRTTRTAVGILLTKLRTGLSNRVLATIFALDNKNKVGGIVRSARKALVSDFVPLHLGFNHVTREEIVDNHTTAFASQLFSDYLSNSVVLVMDGTYIYIQKSHKYKLQRKCYSMYKNRPLVKPMIITATDGYIVSILGPYMANGKNNDAGITLHMMHTNSENMMGWLKEEDVIVVDRGFRDALPFLKECGFRTESPVFLPKKQRQHTTEECNSSRLVTKVRWVVESVNGRMKSWRYLDKVVPNVDIPNLKDYISIVGALCNAFREPLKKFDVADCCIAAEMLRRASMPNMVQHRLAKSNDQRKRCRQWQEIDASDVVPDFPTYTEEELRTLTFGVYQLKQANSYIDQCLEDNHLKLLISEEHGLIHVKMQSRHTTSKRHNLWIEYSKDPKVVTGWYCECPSGARTVGCCSHVASIIWYLGYARHHDYRTNPDRFTPCIEDAATLCTDSDTS